MRKEGSLVKRIFRAAFPLGKSSKKQSNQQRVLELIHHHPCFVEFALWKTTKVDNLNIEDPSKREMTKEYMNIVCTTCQKHICVFKQMDIDQMYDTMLGTSVSIMISSVLKEINKKAATEGIPYMFLEKVDVIISRHIEILADAINNLHLYRDWDKTEDKILATLDILYMAIRIIGDDVPTIVNSMNGELKMILKGSRFDKY